MNEKTYAQLKHEVHKKFSLEMKKLNREYAYSNTNVKVGDIISDHNGTIKVDDIGWAFSYMETLPGCLYSGIRLKKDLTPYKSKERETIYHGNIVKFH